MIQKEDYLKAKQIVQEYEKQLNISVVSVSVCDIKDTHNCQIHNELKSGCYICPINKQNVR